MRSLLTQSRERLVAAALLVVLVLLAPVVLPVAWSWIGLAACGAGALWAIRVLRPAAVAP